MAMSNEEGMAVRTLLMWLLGVPSEWDGKAIEYQSAENAAKKLAEKAGKSGHHIPAGTIIDRLPLVKPLKVPKAKKPA